MWPRGAGTRVPAANKMPFQFSSLRCIALCLLLVPVAVWAQDESPSLGEVARSLRKNKPQQPAAPVSSTVIDNDNLNQVLEDAKKAKAVKADKAAFSMDSSGNALKISSPDVTCSLSFNGRASSVLIRPVLIEDLPLADLVKIDGPGIIQDENLQLQVFNGSNWELREITVGLTLERRPRENAGTTARARVIPAAQGVASGAIERHSDVTLLYHLKASAKPFSTTAFRENIGITPGPDEDWRWSIVEAKGIRSGQAQ